MRVLIDTDVSDEEAKQIQKRLVEFADEFTGPRNYRKLGLVARVDGGAVIGGLLGNTVWDWLQIGTLWVEEGMRGRGVGSDLLERAEAIARDRGCKFAKLDTFEFEAREFYERHGYFVHSVTDDFPVGHKQYHLQKCFSE
jgi:GNAT superfamily N-acetyltransferase